MVHQGNNHVLVIHLQGFLPKSQCLILGLHTCCAYCRQEAFLKLASLLLSCLILPRSELGLPSVGCVHLMRVQMRFASDDMCLHVHSTVDNQHWLCSRLATAFLAGAAGVPQELLSCVSPVLLAMTLEHLPHAHARAQSLQPPQEALVRVHMGWHLQGGLVFCPILLQHAQDTFGLCRDC